MTALVDRLPRALRRFRFSRLPVRWRLALVTALLTTIILIFFAYVVGHLTSDRLHRDFDADLRSTASVLSSHIEVGDVSDFGQVEILAAPPLEEFAGSQGAHVRVVMPDGRPIEATTGTPDLGPPEPGMRRLDNLHVATAPIAGDGGTPLAFVQYARSSTDVDQTVSRLWLILGIGVLAGAALAGAAGSMVAARAMAPVAELTATARSIARTRDSSQRVPEPPSDDEVAELARTLDQMLRALDEARTETEASAERQRQFVADASHELRTPLTSVLANLELLEEALPETGEEREMVESALRSSRRMRRLVADLLLLARADAGRISEREPCDLGKIVEDAVGEARPLASGRSLQLAVADSLPLTGNADELHRLVANLLDNAVRHTPAGTAVEVRAERRDGRAVLEVTDDGPGIPAEARERIFDRFICQAGDTGGGTGLGLAIVKAVAVAHGGAVEALEAAGGGARFQVRMPLAERAREDDYGRRDAGPAAHSGRPAGSDRP